MRNIIRDKEITLIIPAAGKVKSACGYNLACKNPGFLNIGSSLVIDEIKKKSNLKILLVLRNKKSKIFKLNIFKDIKLIEVERQKV